MLGRHLHSHYVCLGYGSGDLCSPRYFHRGLFVPLFHPPFHPLPTLSLLANSTQIFYCFLFHTALKHHSDSPPAHHSDSLPPIKPASSVVFSFFPRDTAQWVIRLPLNAPHATRTSVSVCTLFRMKPSVMYAPLSPIVYCLRFFLTLKFKLHRGGMSTKP